MGMYCTHFGVLSRNQDGTTTIKATIYADEVPQSFPTTGENIARLNSDKYLLGPGSAIIVPNTSDGLKSFVADSTGFYPV